MSEITVETSRFGSMQCSSDSVFTFEKGIPGFEDLKKWVLIGEENDDFFWLQSCEDGDAALPGVFAETFAPEESKKLKERIFKNSGKNENVSLFLVMTIPSNFMESTLNMKAPIMLDNETKKGAQVIFDDPAIPLKQKIFENNRESIPETNQHR